MNKIFTTLIICLSLQVAFGQTFTNRNDLLSNSDFHSGVAIAVTDMNGDGLDDIVRLGQGKILNIEYQQVGGAFENYNFGEISEDSQWSMCVADIDNNGYNDILAGGRYDEVKCVRANADGSGYEMTYLPGPGLFVQGSNLVDINNDGFVDYFACHDDAESRIWSNDGTGLFLEADNWIDMATVPVSDNSGNYGSVWTDFDNDGDQDLYIAKCRQGVNNPTDPRRINALYVNNGDGTFTEDAETHGLKIGAQSWTADFQDIDNDGDMDCFITNHDVPSQLLENTGDGTFVDITESAGITISGLPIQGVMRDFDNDGYMDILVAGSQTNLFRNNGNKTFTKITGSFDNNGIESFGIGDLNNDGFLDVYAGYAQIYTTPSNIDDVVWINDGNEVFHFLTVHLVGEESNRNGIGARLELYGPWGMMIREVRSGESYGIMNSMAQHFGLGIHETVDSLVVRWPSGNVDVYDELSPNQFITVIESTCVSPEVTITAQGETTLCSFETLDIAAPEGYDYLWSNGETTQTISVSEGGQYNVTVSDGTECYGVSNFINVVVDPNETPTIAAEGDTVFCAGGSVVLSTGDYDVYEWSNGEISQSITATEPGEYTVMIQGLCDAFVSAPQVVEVLEAELPETENDTIFEPGTATLMAAGELLNWYATETGGDVLGSGNEFITPPIEETTTFYVENTTSFFGQTFNVGPAEHMGTSEYSSNVYNAQTIFDVHAPFTLKTVKVYTDTPGKRKVILLTSTFELLASKEFELEAGEHILDLQFEIPIGTDLILTTDTQTNMSEFGFASPRFRRTENFNGYPIVQDGIVTIKESNLGTDWYYYFYNWEIKEPSVECVSERVPVLAVLLTTETKDISPEMQLSVYPNPASGTFFLERQSYSADNAELLLLDAAGQEIQKSIMKGEENRRMLDLNNYPSGIYFLRYTTEEGIANYKLIKQ